MVVLALVFLLLALVASLGVTTAFLVRKRRAAAINTQGLRWTIGGAMRPV